MQCRQADVSSLTTGGEDQVILEAWKDVRTVLGKILAFSDTSISRYPGGGRGEGGDVGHNPGSLTG